MKNLKHDFKLPDTIKKNANIMTVKITNRFKYFLLCEFFDHFVKDPSQFFFSNRTVRKIREIIITSFDIMKSCVKKLKIQLKFLISKKAYQTII